MVCRVDPVWLGHDRTPLGREAKSVAIVSSRSNRRAVAHACETGNGYFRPRRAVVFREQYGDVHRVSPSWLALYLAMILCLSIYK